MGEVREEKKEAAFPELKGDDDNGPLTIESMCMNCEENVSTASVENLEILEFMERAVSKQFIGFFWKI